MLRSSPASSMQKTYDDCYLICSTAVYFEKQNNEEEALRSWRSALDNIYYHNAYRSPANYRPRTETEKALQDSLRDMELQCKERVDLLAAIRESRDDSKNDSKNNSLMDSPYYKQRSIRSQSNGSIQSTNTLGDGTVGSVNYPDIARPSLPQRPSTQRPIETMRRVSPDRESYRSHSQTPSLAPPPPRPPQLSPVQSSSRTESPEKKGSMFKTTLRPSAASTSRTGSGKLATTMRSKPPAASKAATLAWPALAPTTSNNSTASDGSARLTPTNSTSDNPFLRPPSPAKPSHSRNTSFDRFTRPASAQETNHKNLKLSHRELESRAEMSTSRRAPPPPPHKPKLKPAPEFPPNPEKLSQPPPAEFPSYRKEFKSTATMDAKEAQKKAALMSANAAEPSVQPPPLQRQPSPRRKRAPGVARKPVGSPPSSPRGEINHRILGDTTASSSSEAERPARARKAKAPERKVTADSHEDDDGSSEMLSEGDARVQHLMKNLPRGVDEGAAKAIFNEIVVKGDEVHWDDVAGLDVAKNALKEAVVYPFLRPDLFMGLREPARGMLLFGPPGTGKTMLARAVATESRSTFFAISASSLTSKFLGESEKLVRALFAIAKALAPSIIFVDEIDSLLSARSGSGEHEATRRIKTEFLIQWSDLAKAAAGREEKDKSIGDATRVLVLAATNLPWAIDDAARRRFVRRQYIPLPEDHVRESQLRKLMGAQKQALTDDDYRDLVELTDGFSGSDVTALAKDAAMGPLRSLGEQLLSMTPDQIRPMSIEDFKASLINIRPSVSKQGLKEFEDWAKDFGERGG
ncbi:MAG: hypothetical protein M1828_003772 [Chrysothrix sp. TS-e1954]|nr:MAG: hypothetical protein M1828_003772 [Chrysothrix sp. TS-e1954]